MKRNSAAGGVASVGGGGGPHGLAVSKRGSISDEIIGEEDLRDVDAVFESLLHSTFSESETSTSMSAATKNNTSRLVLCFSLPNILLIAYIEKTTSR